MRVRRPSQYSTEAGLIGTTIHTRDPTPPVANTHAEVLTMPGYYWDSNYKPTNITDAVAMALQRAA